MDSYFVINFLSGAPEIGSTLPSEDDLHITFLGYVSAPEKYKGELMLKFYDVTDATKPFEVERGESDAFGKFGQFNVIRLNDHGESKNLHAALTEAIGKARGVDFGQTRYSGDKFSPHITLPDMHLGLEIADTITVDNLTLVRHVGGLGMGAVEIVANAKLLG